MSWYDYAACQNLDPEMFFPVGTTGPALKQAGEAKRICASCPVQSMCLEWAVLARIDHGVWGGTSEEDRRALKRRTTRQRREVVTGA
jgi:WhiB family redox-sensing transcriptional regulator